MRFPQNQAPGAFHMAGANSAWCSSNILGLVPGDRRCKSCRADIICFIPLPKTRGIGPPTKGNPMRPVIRYQSQLLYRKSYKPNRFNQIRPAVKASLLLRPTRAGPQLKIYECKTD